MNTERPNILFFFTDDQRFDTIGALGSEAVQTPNLDRLVDRGTAFTHAHIPGGNCGAVCMPSRAMLHTGRTLYHLEGAGADIPPGHAMLGETLQKAGYSTFGTGKWHNGRKAFARSFTGGAEIFFGGMSDHWNVPVYNYDPTGRYDAVIPYCVDPFTSSELRFREADHINAGTHSSEMVCNAAIDFINAGGSEPFFAYVSFLAPHDPRTTPDEFLRMYDPGMMDLPASFLGGHPFDNGFLTGRDEMLAKFPRNPAEIRRHIARYYAMISHLDHQIGRVVSALEDKGILEETVIIFAGDNGLAVGRHGLMGKQNCYEHSCRVPLIYAGPGIPGGVRSEAYVYLLDIYPTICDMLGIGVPASVEGRSMLKCMSDTCEKGRDTMFITFERYQRAVKDRRMKLIEYQVGGERHTQLFDLEEDPREIRNLSADPAFTGKVAEMRSLLVQYRDEWDDLDGVWGREFWGGMEF